MWVIYSPNSVATLGVLTVLGRVGRQFEVAPAGPENLVTFTAQKLLH